MTKKLINSKIIKFSSITTISSLNICAVNWKIVNGSIQIENYNYEFQTYNFNNTTYKAPGCIFQNYNDLYNYLSGLFDFANDKKKTIKDSNGDFNNYILFSVNNIYLFNYNLDKFDFNPLLDFQENGNLNIKLIRKPYVRIQYDSNNYRYKDDFSKKIDNINKDIVNLKSLTIGEFKQKLVAQGIDIKKFDFKYLFYSDEINDNVNFVIYPVKLIYKGDYSDYFEPYKTEIEFIAGNGLELDESFKKDDEIVFVKEKINNKTLIKTHIFEKYNGLKDTNCTIEYKDKRDILNYVTCENGWVFYDGQKIKITINSEIPGFTKKKIEKYKINVNFEVKDPSKYVFNTVITNISNLEIEKDKDFNYLKEQIKKCLGKELKEGFVIYKGSKVESNKFTSGNLENNATYTVVFDENATDFVKEKEKGKIYIKLNFDVEDNNKFKLKQGIDSLKVINNIDVKQGKDYKELLNIIKIKLGNKELKEGFKIYKGSKVESNKFTTGLLEDETTYIVVFANDDTNFVEEKQKPSQNPPKGQEDQDNNNNNNNNNTEPTEETKKRNYSGKKGKENKKCC